MTWSIIARDSETGQFGIAVATKFFAVGARVPHIAAGIGGVATQALVNPYYGIDGVKLLREGRESCDIVKTLIASDSGRESRQLHIMDAAGRIAAMQAGEASGGDKRGKQSAALLIHGDEEWSDLDLRVDDHADPLSELERLEQVSRERWVHFRTYLPTRKNPAGVTDRATIDAGIEAAATGKA